VLYLAICDEKNRIYKDETALATARTGDIYSDLLEEDVIPLPEGSNVMRLPDRIPVGVNPDTGDFTPVDCADIDGKVVKVNTAAAILPPGYTRTFLPAYVSEKDAAKLPLFGYTAVAFKEDELVVAAVRTDERETWNPKEYNSIELSDLVERMRNRYPENRIIKQLSGCALEYGCFTAQNVFFQKNEGGIPVSPICNANCLGCISLQPSECCPSPQERITFVPTVDEVVEVLTEHLINAEDPIISFGQGCEGEPSVQYKVIAEAIKRVRKITSRGTININTNAGFTDAIKQICDAGINSMRVSLLSARKDYYNAYHRPVGYTFDDVEESIKYAVSKGVFVSINYLVFPGFTDQEREVYALADFIERTGINMIQFRNLNIDPEIFVAEIMKGTKEIIDGEETDSVPGEILDNEQTDDLEDIAVGMVEMIQYLKDCFPELKIGNFSMQVNN